MYNKDETYVISSAYLLYIIRWWYISNVFIIIIIINAYTLVEGMLSPYFVVFFILSIVICIDFLVRQLHKPSPIQ